MHYCFCCEYCFTGDTLYCIAYVHWKALYFGMPLVFIKWKLSDLRGHKHLSSDMHCCSHLGQTKVERKINLFEKYHFGRVLKWVLLTHASHWGRFKRPSVKMTATLTFGLMFDDMQTQNRVWSYMTPIVLTETRCPWATQKLQTQTL